ncbi:MAG: M48 family metalloprotease [Planctomycetota bacterium]
MRLLLHLTSHASAGPGEFLPPSYEEKLAAVARLYNRRKRRLAFLHLAAATAYLLVMLFLFTVPLAARAQSLCERHLGGSPVAAGALYAFLFFLLYRLACFPIHYESEFRLEHDFMLSNESFRGWLWRDFKTYLVSQLLLIPAVVLFYAFLDVAGEIWWLYAAGAYIVFSILIGRLFPFLIFPLFFKRKALPPGALAERLADLARKADFAITGVHSFDLSRQTRKVAAGLVGLGRTRQILLSDNLLAAFSPEEIEAVFAHELGHHVQSHFLRLFVFASSMAIAGFYFVNLALGWAVPRLRFENRSSIATLPLYVLALAGFSVVVRPLTNAHSRKLETESDAYAVRACGSAAALAAALEKLARTNLADARPGKLTEVFLYDHPPLAARLARIRRVEEDLKAASAPPGPEVPP